MGDVGIILKNTFIGDPFRREEVIKKIQLSSAGWGGIFRKIEKRIKELCGFKSMTLKILERRETP